MNIHLTITPATIDRLIKEGRIAEEDAEDIEVVADALMASIVDLANGAERGT